MIRGKEFYSGTGSALAEMGDGNEFKFTGNAEIFYLSGFDDPVVVIGIVDFFCEVVVFVKMKF